MILNEPRQCARGCGCVVEWSVDANRRVGLVEADSRALHVCPRRQLGAYIRCACGGQIHTYADGRVISALTGQPHVCPKVRELAAVVAATAPAPAPVTEQPPDPPRRSLNDALGVG